MYWYASKFNFSMQVCPNEVTRADKHVGFKCISAYLASKLSVALSNHGFLQFYILTYTYKTVPITRHQESPRFINSRSSIGIIFNWENWIWVLLCAIFASRDSNTLVGCDFIVVNFEKLKKKTKIWPYFSLHKQVYMVFLLVSLP